MQKGSRVWVPPTEHSGCAAPKDLTLLGTLTLQNTILWSSFGRYQFICTQLLKCQGQVGYSSPTPTYTKSKWKNQPGYSTDFNQLFACAPKPYLQIPELHIFLCLRIQSFLPSSLGPSRVDVSLYLVGRKQNTTQTRIPNLGEVEPGTASCKHSNSFYRSAASPELCFRGPESLKWTCPKPTSADTYNFRSSESQDRARSYEWLIPRKGRLENASSQAIPSDAPYPRGKHPTKLYPPSWIFSGGGCACLGGYCSFLGEARAAGL